MVGLTSRGTRRARRRRRGAGRGARAVRRGAAGAAGGATTATGRAPGSRRSSYRAAFVRFGVVEFSLLLDDGGLPRGLVPLPAPTPHRPPRPRRAGPTPSRTPPSPTRAGPRPLSRDEGRPFAGGARSGRRPGAHEAASRAPAALSTPASFEPRRGASAPRRALPAAPAPAELLPSLRPRPPSGATEAAARRGVPETRSCDSGRRRPFRWRRVDGDLRPTPGAAGRSKQAPGRRGGPGGVAEPTGRHRVAQLRRTLGSAPLLFQPPNRDGLPAGPLIRPPLASPPPDPDRGRAPHKGPASNVADAPGKERAEKPRRLRPATSGAETSVKRPSSQEKLCRFSFPVRGAFNSLTVSRPEGSHRGIGAFQTPRGWGKQLSFGAGRRGPEAARGAPGVPRSFLPAPPRWGAGARASCRASFY